MRVDAKFTNFFKNHEKNAGKHSRRCTWFSRTKVSSNLDTDATFLLKPTVRDVVGVLAAPSGNWGLPYVQGWKP